MLARRAFLTAILAIQFFLFPLSGIAGAGPANEGWKPVDPAQLALKAPVVEKDADAEALFWEVAVEKGDQKADLRHYLRIKIFTDRGRERHGKVTIVYSNGTSISEIAGRTIKPDGTIVPLNPGDIFENNILTIGKRKAQAKTFAMPAVEAGAIIEYRWRETQKDALFVRLEFQLEMPVHSLVYTIKDQGLNFSRGLPMNMRDVVFDRDEKTRTMVARRSNVPAFHREPQMPPETEVRAWMLLHNFSRMGEMNYWEFLGNDLYESSKGSIKPNDEVRRAVAPLIAGAATPEQKLERIYDFCRTRIRNVDNDSSLTEEARKRIASTKSPGDTLKRESGTGEQIDWLFAAMANAAGMEARLAKTGDRSKHFMDVRSPLTSPLTSYHIAVQVDGQWRFFDPAGTWLPFGMLRWQEEGMPSLVTDPINSRFMMTPVSAPDRSKKSRRGEFKLNDDGSIEGLVRVEYTGQTGAEWKDWLNDLSVEEREKRLRESVKQEMPTAELSEIRYENVSDPLKPLVCGYRLRVPDYAQRTVKRLLLQPAVFQFGVKQLFPNQERRHPIYFHYPWSEDDEVVLHLPAGFEPESVLPPPNLKMETIAEYGLHLQYNVNSRMLLYKRRFSFGGGGALIFPRTPDAAVLASIYPTLKRFFEVIYDRDNFAVSLKMEVVASK
ncbi:MAG: DUF3857 domain-containing transglutaminase family protein [Blastocatellia bacterium]